MTFPLKKPRIPLSRPKNKQTAMVQFTEDYPAQEMLKVRDQPLCPNLIFRSTRAIAATPRGHRRKETTPSPGKTYSLVPFQYRKIRKPKPHKRRWRKIVWRDAMILKRRYDRINGEKEGISNGKVNGTGQKSTEEHSKN